jgi:hypothetical protein
VRMAGTDAQKLMALKATCIDPLAMQAFLLWRLHLPGGWHRLTHPAIDHMYHIVMSPMKQ